MGGKMRSNSPLAFSKAEPRASLMEPKRDNNMMFGTADGVKADVSMSRDFSKGSVNRDSAITEEEEQPAQITEETVTPDQTELKKLADSKRNISGKTIESRDSINHVGGWDSDEESAKRV